MLKIVDIKPLSGYRLWLRFTEGTEGEIDLSSLAGRGVFAAWEEPGAFERVGIGEGGEVVWEGGIDLCPDDLYMRLTGRRPEEVFPNLKQSGAHA